MNNRSILVLGGARSGKSARALAHSEGFTDKVFIATAEARDEEMRTRIMNHKRARHNDWRLIEEPAELALRISQQDRPGRIVVVDCLTVWLSNILERHIPLEPAIVHLETVVQECEGCIVLVSNEVGLGIVPQQALARDFRDHQGKLNQRVAAVADRVEVMVAGLPLPLKSTDAQ